VFFFYYFFFVSILRNQSFNDFAEYFALDHPIDVAIHDAFVVKYDAGMPMPNVSDALSNVTKAPSREVSGQTFLPLHCDQSSHSFTIALNSSTEYEGGGTYFPAFGRVFRPGTVHLLA